MEERERMIKLYNEEICYYSKLILKRKRENKNWHNAKFMLDLAQRKLAYYYATGKILDI